MKVRKIVAFVLAACLLVVNVQVTAFADVLESEESIENLVDNASPSEGENMTEEASFSDAEYIEEETAEEIADESDTNNGELSDIIVLTAETSDGITVTMKAEMSAFASSKHASPSEAEKDELASPSDTIESDEFDPDLLTLVADVVEEKDEEAVDEALEKETKDDNIASRKTYDIYVLYDGEKIEPLEGKKVEVSFAITNAPSGADEVTIYHHTEDGIETIVDEKLDEATASQAVYEVGEQTEDKTEEKKETVSTEEIKDIDETDENLDGDVYDDVSMITVTGETDGFSLYTIDFTYNAKTVSIPGDSTGNLLADILKDVGIEGQILEAKAYQDTECRIPAENGIVKNETGVALFKIYEKNDVWYADAINAFNTEHGLYVKTEDAEYTIKVTDDQYVASVTVNETETAYSIMDAAWSDAQTAGTATVKLLADVSANLTNGSGKNITLDLNGYVLKSAGSGSVITNSGTLTIMDTANSTAGTHYFKVNSSGLWVLDPSATSADYTFDAAKGLQKSGSASSDIPAENSFIAVTGGCITGGNKISNNGGGVYSKDGSFTLQAGNIVGNTGSNAGGGVYVYSYEKASLFTMTGGSIAGNIAQQNGEDKGIGGGVSCSCNSDETNCTFTMTGGIIAANKAQWGGGIYVSKGCEFNISGDARVSCNASSLRGSAVYLTGINSSKALFQMSGNASMSSNKGNACVYIASDGNFTMTGGSITDNRAETSDHKFAGVCAFQPGNSVVSVGGTAVIRDNKLTDGTECNLYLNNGNVAISTETPFATGASIGVTTATAPTVRFTDNGKKADEAYFFSDNPSYTDKYNNSGYLELVAGYAVTCTDCENGSVSVGSQKSAYQGETVTVMTTPAEGYMLDAVKITKTDDGTDVTTAVGYAVKTGTFTMPDYAITVSAIFKIAVFVCQTGSGETAVKYTSIADALAAAHEGESAEIPTTITLIADDKENVVIPGDDATTTGVDETRFITIDLNGYVLKGTGTGSVITNSGTLEIADSDAAAQDHIQHCFVVDEKGLWTLDATRSTSSTTYTYSAAEGLKKLKEGTSGTSAEYVSSTDIPASGSTIAVAGGCITGGGTGKGSGINNKGTLTLNSGTICGNNAGSGNNYDGGGVYVNSDATFTMIGGTICGNCAHNGAGVDVAGTFNMTGGTICYNKTAHMGAVIVEENRIFRMSGGTISHNFAGNCGAGIRTQKGTAYISGDASIIYNCTKDGNGSAIQIGYGTVNMSGGTVAHNYNTGTSEAYSAAVLAWDNGGAFNMSGGIITDNACGGVTCNESTVKIGGTAKISGNTSKDGTVRNLYLYSGKMITLGTGTGDGENGVPVPARGMSVGVTTQTAPTADNPVSVTGVNSADYSSYFAADDATNYEARNYKNSTGQMVKLIKSPAICEIVSEGDFKGNRYSSIAGALTDAGTTATTIQLIADTSECVTINKTQNITLDLNGYVLKGNGSGRVISNNGTLTIKDSNNTKTHYFKYSKSSDSKSSEWTLYDDADENAKKSAIEVDEITGTTADNTLIKVYGGCITGGNLESNHGGGILVEASSTFTMTGGNICGNKAKQGGGLYTGSNTKVNLNNITIAGNYANTNCGGMMFNADTSNGYKPSLTIGGTVKIIENTSTKDKDKNLTLWTAATPLEIGSSIKGSKLGITIRKSDSEIIDGKFTTNGTADDVQYFTSDAAGYEVVYKPDTGTTGHLELAKSCTVTLDGNGATTAGSVTSITAVSGSAMPAITGEGSLPTRTVYTFAGYFDAQTGGNRYYNADGTSAKDWDKTTDTATLYAQWAHVHGDWKYTASKSELTAMCGNDGCTLAGSKVSITINAANKSYDGNAYIGASIDNISAWKEAGLATPEIYYYVKGQTAKLDGAPTAAGEYTAKITAGDKTACADFTISQKLLTITGTKADGKTYDGTKTAAAHIGTLSEIVDADKGSVTVSIKTAEFDDKDVGNSKSVTVSYSLTGAKSGNYTVADSTTNADIEKRPITLTSGSATRAYDGKPLTKNEVKDSLTGSADTAGFVDGEGADYVVTGSQTDVGSSANTFTYTLNEGTKADNYTITKEEGVLKVLEAEKCIITFEMNGHGTQVPVQYVARNQKISRPDDPTADHWCFKGWYRSGMETAWDFLTDTVSEDITLYAKWTEGDHTVRFNCDGISDQYVQHNEIITLPGAQKSGYEFQGWFENGETAGKLHTADSAYTVTEDVSFTPSFAEKKVIAGKEIKISDTSDIDASKAGKGSNETEKLIILQVSEAKLAGAYPVDISSSIRESTLETYLQAAPSANELIFKLNVKLTDVYADSKETSTTTKLTYNVTPVFYAMKDGAAVSGEQVVSNSEIRGPVKFCLTVPTSALAVAEVKHMSSDGTTVKDTKYYDVQTITNEDGVTEKYIEAYSSNFSNFVITFTDTRPTNSKSQSSCSSSAITAAWIKDAKGWRYRFAGGGYATNGWYEIDNPYASGTQEKKSWFHFGTDNYMHTGWFTDKDGKKYYLHTVEDGTLGRMYHGKQTIDGKVYDFSEIHDGYFGHLIETDTKKNKTSK